MNYGIGIVNNVFSEKQYENFLMDFCASRRSSRAWYIFTDIFSCFLSTFWWLYIRWYLQFSWLPCTWVHDSLGWQGGIVILNQNRVKIVELLFFDSLIGSLTSLPSFSISSSCYSSGASAIVTLLISSLSLSSMVLQNSKLLSPSLSLSINLQLKEILHHCPTHHKTVAVNLAAHVLMNTSV